MPHSTYMMPQVNWKNEIYCIGFNQRCEKVNYRKNIVSRNVGNLVIIQRELNKSILKLGHGYGIIMDLCYCGSMLYTCLY